MVDLYNQNENDKDQINYKMRSKIFTPFFQTFLSMLPYDGAKYSLFDMLKIYSQQSNFEYTQFFKVNVQEKQKYFKIEILKNVKSGDKIKMKLTDIT